MKAYLEKRLLDLSMKLDDIACSDTSLLDQCDASLQVLVSCDAAFKETIRSGTFSSPEDEIRYFRHQRPQLTSQWMYYARVYHLELQRPVGSASHMLACLEEQLRRIDAFFTAYASFVSYIRSGDTRMDHLWFLRRNTSYKDHPGHSFPGLDPVQTTVYDLKVGKLYASERLASYLHQRIRELQQEFPALLSQEDRKDAVAASPAIPAEEKLFRSWQVERRLGISSSNLQRLRASGQIAFFQVNHTIWYRESDVQAFLHRNRHKDFDDAP